MKNWQKIIIICASIIYIVVAGYFIFRKPINNYYIHVKTSTLTKEVDDVFNVVNECKVSTYANGADTKPYYLSENSNKLTVNYITGQCTCLEEGETKIVICLQTDNNVIKKEITVIISKKKIDPSYINITNSKVVLTDINISAENPIITDGQNCNIEIDCQNDYVEYNVNTGTVTSKGIYGADKVTIKIYKKDGSYLETNFNVLIKENNDVAKTIAISKDETKKVSYDSYMIEFGGNVGVPTIANENILELVSSDYGYFYIKGLEIGQSEVYITDGLNQLTFTIIIE